MNDKKRGRQKSFVTIGDILKKFDGNGQKDLPLEYSKDKYVSREFQKYGYDLAKELGDLKNKSLYIKLAKETPRGFLETARSFVKDAHNARSKARLFMWRLQQLKKESKNK